MSRVVLYSTRTCGYCASARRLLARKGIPFDEIDVTADDARRAWLVEASGGRTTVPQVFIDGRPIGGSDELHKLERAGELDRLLGGPASRT